MQCTKRAELHRKAVDILNKLIELTREEVEVLRQNNQMRLLELDKQLEQTFGEKERAFGALREHEDEHRC